jgi:iron-sulfur cluster repair protein YtfE (RIC family)
MNTQTTNHEVFEKMHREHNALREKLARIHDVFSGVVPAPDEIRVLLHEFEKALATHFSNEETGGFFDDVTSLSPSSAGEAGRLCIEHRDLQHEAAELCRFAASGSPSMPWWRELASRCHTFSQKLMQHESAENRLLQMAYRRDEGVVD